MTDRMKVSFPRLLTGLSFVCLITLSSCRGDGFGLTSNGDPEGTAEGYATQIQPIFDTNCTRCHSPGGIGFIQTGGNQDNGLDLTRGNSYNKIVNQPTFELPNTSPVVRVLPEDPDGSYLIQKISSASPKFGNRMPLDGPPFLSQSDIQLIRDWIEEGAPDN